MHARYLTKHLCKIVALLDLFGFLQNIFIYNNYYIYIYIARNWKLNVKYYIFTKINILQNCLFLFCVIITCMYSYIIPESLGSARYDNHKGGRRLTFIESYSSVLKSMNTRPWYTWSQKIRNTRWLVYITKKYSTCTSVQNKNTWTSNLGCKGSSNWWSYSVLGRLVVWILHSICF